MVYYYVGTSPAQLLLSARKRLNRVNIESNEVLTSVLRLFLVNNTRTNNKHVIIIFFNIKANQLYLSVYHSRFLRGADLY